MARQANILAFEDVKASRRRTRSSVSAKNPTQQSSKRNTSARRPSVSSDMSSRTRANNSSARSTTNRVSLYSTASQQRSKSSYPDHSARKVGSKGSQAAQSRQKQDFSTEQRSEQAVEKKTKTSKFADLKRNRAKAKADRSFTKQFAGKESAAASGEGAPRAALYKGEMGKSHKRASKAQNATRSSSQKTAKPRLSEKFSLRSPKSMATLVVSLCLIAACAFIYPTAQQYYVTSREYDQLQAEYAALEERKKSLNAEVESLQTAEGIETRARQEFGWVKEGENAVNVYGLEIEEKTDEYAKTVPAGSVLAPETWYTALLDFVFMV